MGHLYGNRRPLTTSRPAGARTRLQSEKLSSVATVYSGDTERQRERAAEAVADPSTPSAEAPAKPWTRNQESSAVGEPPQSRGAGGARPNPDEDQYLTFQQLHTKYQGKIYNLIFRMVGSPEDAEDLTVETFLNAYRHWDRFRGESRIYTWLYQIAVNNCKNHFKQRDRRREREPISLDDSIETDSGELTREVADWRAAPENLLLNQEMMERLQKAVDALPEEYRTVFLLDQEDLSYEEIARITGLTVPAVKTRLHRARQRIKQRLEPYYRGS